MNRVWRIARWFFVTIGVVLLTSFGVDATIGGKSVSQSALGILALTVRDSVGSTCPSGTTRLGGEFMSVCVDLYEASPDASCNSVNITNANETRANINDSSCKPQSVSGSQPWTFVTLNQAQELCARAGKRLLTNAEWYRASLGSPDIPNNSPCNVRSGFLAGAGANTQCVSGVGAYDTIGNAWEWIDAQIENGVYEGRRLPQSGYVSEADQDGVVIKTSDVAAEDYHADYFWSEEEGVFGMLRGGFYGSENDAGVYSIQGKTALSFSGNAVGFRCAFDLAN